MNDVIYWFSGTGNSLHVARKIAEHFPSMELVPITKSLVESKPAIKGKNIGFVFPVYAYGPPAIVKRLMAAAEIGEVEYCFAVATHGGGPANSLMRVKQLFESHDLPLQAAHTVRMPSNYVVGSNPLTGEKAKAIFEKGDLECDEVCALLVKKTLTPVSTTGLGGKFMSWAVHPLFMKGLKKVDGKFFAQESCTGCGICVKVCPMGNITLTGEKKPKWGGECEYCLGCIHICPEHSIQTSILTKRRRRYRHRDIPVKDLLSRNN
jgi:ferredoxin